MPRYRVYVRVEYELEADSPEQASKIVKEGAEFPLTPFNETQYCESSEILLVHPITDINKGE
jgi:hypothetical protein